MAGGREEAGSQRGDVERLFAEYLVRRESGEKLELEEFCAAHPEHGDGLRALNRNWDEVAGVLGQLGISGSIHRQLAESLGKVVDSRVMLPETDEPALSPEVVGRLSNRRGPYGRYKIHGEVARGGMGAILRVWDEDLRRDLAMKVVLGNATDKGAGDREETSPIDPGTLGRFLEEAQVTAQLDHPGIVPVHELGLDAGGQVYFTMKLVKGQTLREVFDKVNQHEEGWTITRTLHVLLKVCEAMAYAHEKEVIHRDLKPANVMVGRFGEVYVMDWGLARVLGQPDSRDLRIQAPDRTSPVRSERKDLADASPEAPLMTMDGDVIGTPAYMSPEQASGNLEKIGRHSDVYAVGAMLYQLLTSQMPYVKEGERISPHMVLARVDHGPPTPVVTLAPEAPSELVAICEKSMAREASRRYSNTMELGEDLRAFLEDRVVKAHRTGAVIELVKWVHRNRIAAASLGFAFVSVLVGLFVTLEQKSRADDSASEAQANADRARDQELLARTRADEAGRRTYIATLAVTQQALLLNNVAEAQRHLQECEPSLRQWEWDYLQNAAGGGSRVLQAHPDVGVRALAFSPDGALLATVAGTKLSGSVTTGQLGGPEVHVRSVRTGELVQVLPVPEGICSAVLFSGCDKTLLAAGGAGLFVWDTETWELLETVTTFERADDWEGRLVESEDGAFLAYGLMVVDGTAYEEVLPLASGLATAMQALDPKGRYVCRTIATFESLARSLEENATQEPEAVVYDLEDGTVVSRLRGFGGSVLAMAFSPVGEELAIVSGDGWLRVWAIRTGQRIAAFEVARDDLTGDAGVIAQGTQRLIHVLEFSADGTLIATGGADKTLSVWRWRDGKLMATHRGHTLPLNQIAFVPGGTTLASASADGTVRLWPESRDPVLLRSRGRNDFLGPVWIHPASGDLVVGATAGSIHTFDSTSLLPSETPPGIADQCPKGPLSPDGRLMAIAQGEKVEIRELESDTVLETRTFPNAVAVLALSNGHRMLAIRDETRDRNDPDHSFVVHDLDSDRQIRFTGHTSRVNTAHFSPSSQKLLLTSNQSAQLWDLDTEEQLTSFDGHEGNVYGALFHPSGARAFTFGYDRTIKVWDLKDYDLLLTLRGHQNWVLDAVFSPDGTRFISRDFYEVRHWDASVHE